MRRPATVGVALALAATMGLGACSSHEGEYAGDADTGAAAPATKMDVSETVGAPDSTAGINDRTGQPSISGDTSGRTGTSQNPRPRSP